MTKDFIDGLHAGFVIGVLLASLWAIICFYPRKPRE